MFVTYRAKICYENLVKAGEILELAAPVVNYLSKTSAVTVDMLSI